MVTSEGLEQQPIRVPFILGTLGSQHKQVCMGFQQKGPQGPRGSWPRLTNALWPPTSQVGQ